MPSTVSVLVDYILLMCSSCTEESVCESYNNIADLPFLPF